MAISLKLTNVLKNNYMKNKFNYFNNGVSITKSQFETIVPSDWKNNLNEYGEYSWGYFRAVLRD